MCKVSRGRASTATPPASLVVGELDGAGVDPRHLRFLLFAWIISRIDVIDRPRPNTMDLKDGLFLGPGEMVHLRLHNRDAAGRYILGLAGIELVSHADVEGAGDHSYVLDRRVRVRRNLEIRWELNAEGEGHCLIQRSLNHGNLRAGWKRRHVGPLKIRRRNKRVSLRRIRWRDQEDANSAQKGGRYCNLFHSFLLKVLEILRMHGCKRRLGCALRMLIAPRRLRLR